jgi:biopolymer transport protein TolR
MAFSIARRGKLKAEINVTPLVDVVLVLLIIFMVVTPMLTRGRDVQLPLASAVEGESEIPSAVVVTVTAQGELWLENRRVALGQLVKEVLARRLDPATQQVLIKADASVTVRDLRPLLQQLKRAHIEQIAFAVLEQRSPTP